MYPGYPALCVPWAILPYVYPGYPALCVPGLPWATLLYVYPGYPGLPCSMYYPGLPCPTLYYPGLPWATPVLPCTTLLLGFLGGFPRRRRLPLKTLPDHEQLDTASGYQACHAALRPGIPESDEE